VAAPGPPPLDPSAGGRRRLADGVWEVGVRSFRDQVVIVTGASSGIGASLSRELARRGAAVVLVARRRERLQALAAELEDLHCRALAMAASVTRDGELEAVARRTVERFGRLDVAVANAGFAVGGRLESLTLSDYRRQMETNVFGVLRTTYAVLPELKKTGGTLVLMGSAAGYLPAPGASAYAMSGFAVRALAEALRGELVPAGVAVVLVSPGFVDSDIRRTDRRGRVEEEALDPIPAWLRLPADTAARRIARGIAKRRAEIIVTRHARLAVLLGRHFPHLLRWALIHAEGVRAKLRR
jgi:short-subunit dehydrogenase